MHYDADIFNKYRDMAITDMDDLIVGNTYHSNTGASFVLKGLLTNAESYAKSGLVWDDFETADKIDWVEVEGEWEQTFSLTDRNIGPEGGYNPWLIFETEELAQACRTELVVTWPRDEYSFDYYDDWATEMLDMMDRDYDWRDGYDD